MSQRESFEKRLLRYRHTNAKGNVIPMHHAFKCINYTLASKLMMFLVAPILAIVIWYCFPLIADFWRLIMEWWMPLISRGYVTELRIPIMLQSFMMPAPGLSTYLPTADMVWMNFIICVIAFLLSFLLPYSIIPFTYLIRACILIQLSASVYFFIIPNFFPYQLPEYMVNCMGLSMSIMFLVPLVLGGIYYIFDFPVWQKLLVTAMCLGFFLIAAPMQYMVHAWIIHNYSVMFMPILYFMFGMLPQVIAFVAFYALGMTWRHRKPKELGRFA